MQKKTFLLIAGLLATAGGVSAIAAVGDHGEGGWRGFGKGGWHHKSGQHGGGHGRALLRLDGDKDGDVTLAEFLKPREDRFAELDTNKDGTLDAAKLTAHFKGKSGDRIDKMFKRLDANGDGRVSREEFALASAGQMMGHGPRGGHGWRHGKGRHGWGGATMDEDRAEAGPQGQPGEAPAPQKQAEGSPTPPAQGMEDEQRGAGGWRGRHHGMRMGEGRGDGRGAGRAQLVADIEERFKSLDKNGDGFIDKPEMEAAQADEVAYRVKRMLHEFDSNKDGKITKDEFLARSKERFARLDLNDDGKITADDMPPSQRGSWKSR